MMLLRRTFLTITAMAALSACAMPVEPVVAPELSERLRVSNVTVRVAPEGLKELALRDNNYLGNYQRKVIDGLMVQGPVADLPVRVVLDVSDTNVNATGQSSARGTFTIVNARNAQTLSGPNEFNAVLPGDSTPVAGGLVGLVIVSAAKGIINAQQGPHRRKVEALGTHTSTEVKTLIFGKTK